MQGYRFLFFSFIFIFASALNSVAGDMQNAVVKVFVTSNQIDFARPWQSSGSSSSSGSGCVIEGNRILTNAHVVGNSTFIQIRKESSPKKYTAKVLVIGLDCDLAILSVDDPEFFRDVEPIPLGGLPMLQDEVTVIGFPMGGDKLSITKGVVSRIEVIPYAQSAKQLLGIQIDAAINPGNSGGPVFQNGKLVGVAMQLRSDSQSIGYMIPIPVITHFLDDEKDGKYDGFPSIGIEYRLTENTALRDFYHIQPDQGGIVVTNVQPFFSADGYLEKQDVILSFDGVPVAEDGTFEYRKDERLSFSHLVNEKQIGKDVTVKILRDGEVKDIIIPLTAVNYLVQPPNAVEQPPYYIYGGLVFTILTTDLLQSWGDKWWEGAPFDFLYFLIGKGRLNEDRKKEIVVLLDVLPDDRNIGYLGFSDEVITAVNGQGFSSFKEFVLLIEAIEGDYAIFTTFDGANIVISRKEIEDVTDKISERNNILKRYSDDVKEWLKK